MAPILRTVRSNNPSSEAHPGILDIQAYQRAIKWLGSAYSVFLSIDLGHGGLREDQV